MEATKKIRRTRLILKFVDIDKNGRDVFIDQNGDYIVNTNVRNAAPSWCTKYPRKEFDGEPDLPLPDTHFKVMVKTWPEDIRFRYMLLNRLQGDCDFFLGCGRRNPNCLWAGDVKGQIEKMRELWNSLPMKPEWLSMFRIKQYEKQMLNPSEA